ncbi:hypothetical protein Tco_1542164, partial [Tanacetum coccineum]
MHILASAFYALFLLVSGSFYKAKEDMAYWVDPIRRIEFESASILVEIELTWSLGFVSVELASVEAQISLIKLEFSSCLFADSLMNLLM